MITHEDDSVADASTLDDGAVVLSLFAGGHLGDVLCTSPLPRMLYKYQGLRTYATDHPNTRAIFSNNPYVCGFVRGFTVSLDAIQNGDGHISQRLMQGFELPVDPSPKPEIYLTREERRWAKRQRRQWPSDKPVCIVSSAAISDSWMCDYVDWNTVAQALSARYTLIQPVLTEAPIAGAVAYKGLSVRQYISLFSVADRFVGITSGGTHIAAAFGVPTLVIIWNDLQRKVRFPIVGPVTVSDLDWKAAFLYPHHWFIAAEDVSGGADSSAKLEAVLDDMDHYGRRGRPTSILSSIHNPCGFVLKAPTRVLALGAQKRLWRVPSLYGTEVCQPESNCERADANEALKPGGCVPSGSPSM